LRNWLTQGAKETSTVSVTRASLLYKRQVQCVVADVRHYVTVNPKPSCIITRGFGMVWGLLALHGMLFRYGIWIWNDNDDVYDYGVAQLVSAWRDENMSDTFTPHFAEVSGTHSPKETDDCRCLQAVATTHTLLPLLEADTDLKRK
jgi:hypothetical protein